jgi:hypothetical protein
VKKVGPGQGKLSDRSCKMVFLGYEAGTKGYRLVNPQTEQLHISRDVVFEEAEQWDWNKVYDDQLASDVTEMFTVDFQNHVTNPTHTEESNYEEQGGNGGSDAISAPSSSAALTPQPSATPQFSATPIPTQFQINSSGQVSEVHGSSSSANTDTPETVPLKYRTIADLLDSTEEVLDFEYSGMCMLAVEEPVSVEEALAEDCWKKAMAAELQSIDDNNTWTWSDLPKGHKAIGLKWVYKLKKDASGNVLKHKARLVAKGYAQREGVDFDEVFAPVARLETIRVLLALSAHGNWEVHHMDVKSAFLNGHLQEVYVLQSPGFQDPVRPCKVLKLNKALYGLKQAPRAWNARLDSELFSLGFNKCVVEHAVYRKGAGNSLLVVGVYVDDLIMCGPSVNRITEFKQQMMHSFNMSDLGLLSYYLGMEVRQKEKEITICQKAYAAKIVEHCKMTDCNPTDTPMEQRIKLTAAKKGIEAS